MKYPVLRDTKRVTAKWLDQAFAPLRDYLDRAMPEEAERVLPYLHFMGYDEGKYHYRNCETKGYIVIDRQGQTVHCSSYAFYVPEYDEDDSEPFDYNREGSFIHPNVSEWMARLPKRASAKFGMEVEWFLQSYWGPIVNYSFDDLKKGYPLGRERTPYCLYLYPAEFPTHIVIQFVGDEIAEHRCTPEEYRQYLRRQLTLQAGGWHVVTVIREMLGEHAEHFRRYLDKAIELGRPRYQRS